MKIQRTIEKEVKILAKEFPIVTILGPRQSGKTTLAKELFPNYQYISLEDLDVRKAASEDPRGFIEQYNHRVIFDEIQYVPQIFSYLQTHSDALDETAAFILTGSQNYLLMEHITQSLSGRVGIATLLPFSIEEALQYHATVSADELLFSGFFPRIFDKNIRPSRYYADYIKTYIERDVRTLKNITNYTTFNIFLQLLAGRSGQLLNVNALANEANIARQTAEEWLSVLETSYIIFRLHPFHKNYKKRLTKQSKVYFYDTGIVCHLLGLTSADQLVTHYLRGSIFESMVISNFIKENEHHGGGRQLFFWRDHQHNEVDLLIEQAGVVQNYEVKSGKTARQEYTKGLHFWNKLSNSSANNSTVIYGGDKELLFDGIHFSPWNSRKLYNPKTV
ncbi:MAG TPA: ATP-binding protein [Patescibacteria group bacterium]|nr:ATP-binding protein [Patescibacteria group bacterium]